MSKKIFIKAIFIMLAQVVRSWTVMKPSKLHYTDVDIAYVKNKAGFEVENIDLFCQELTGLPLKFFEITVLNIYFP